MKALSQKKSITLSSIFLMLSPNISLASLSDIDEPRPLSPRYKKLKLIKAGVKSTSPKKGNMIQLQMVREIEITSQDHDASDSDILPFELGQRLYSSDSESVDTRVSLADEELILPPALQEKKKPKQVKRKKRYYPKLMLVSVK